MSDKSKQKDDRGERPFMATPPTYPMELLYEEGGLYHYSAFCCDYEYPDWGVMTSGTPLGIVSECPSNPIPSEEGDCFEIPAPVRSQLDSVWLRKVFVGDSRIRNASDTFKEIPGQARISDPTIVQLVCSAGVRASLEDEEFCDALSGKVFDLRLIDYKNRDFPHPANAVDFTTYLASNPRQGTADDQREIVTVHTRVGARIAMCAIRIGRDVMSAIVSYRDLY